MDSEQKSQHWKYDHESGETFTSIEIEDKMVKWTIDIIENPEAHFKAEDQRRFSVFREEYQSFLNFIVRPKFLDIPKDIHDQIAEFIRQNFTIEDLEESYRNRLQKAFHYWVPTQDKLIYQTGSKEGAEEYYDVDSGILHIYHDFIDPFDRERVQKLIPYMDIVSQESDYPKEVVDAAKSKAT